MGIAYFRKNASFEMDNCQYQLIKQVEKGLWQAEETRGGRLHEFKLQNLQRLLVEGQKTDATESLKKIVTAKDSGVAAIHALWTLQGLGLLDDATHKTALASASSPLRRNATRAISADDRGKSVFFSAGVISDPDPITKLAAFVKLAEFSTTKEIQSVVASIARNPASRSDEWLSDASRLLAKKHKTDTYKEGPNLLPNPGLETVAANGLPEGWKRRDYNNAPGTAGAEWTVVSGAENVHGGGHALRCITRDNADTSLYADVTLKPNTQYRLSGWVKGHALRGKIGFNDHLGRAETERAARGDTDWTLVEVDYNSGSTTQTSINILHVAVGDGYFDDVKLCELEAFGDLRAAMVRLDEREREVIALRFFDELSQTCIARRLNVSQMHVSRLQQKALRRLRELMAEESLPVSRN